MRGEGRQTIMAGMWHRGDVVAKLRHAQGWSQEDLARRAGVHKASVVRAEANEAFVTLDTWHKVATALGTTVDALNELVDASQPGRVTSPVTGAGHLPGLPEAPQMDTPKARLIHFVYSLSEEHAAVLFPLTTTRLTPGIVHLRLGGARFSRPMMRIEE